MAYDASLAKRIDELIKEKKAFTRKEMFGGIGYLLNGNMCVGIHNDDLIVRFNPTKSDELMKKKHVKPFVLTGRPMKGWLLVSPEGAKGSNLDKWLGIALDFVKTVPAKNK